MSINELFGTESKETVASARMLNGTAELTRLCSNAAAEMLKKMEANIEEYRERIAESATDTKVMDALISEFNPMFDIEEDDPLRSLSDEIVESMLKSQQSKRSRLKGKTMTLDNYMGLLTASIAEDTIRELYNKPKSAHVNFRQAGSVNYTIEQLERYEADQDALRKEIRNVQSKKSIMKSREDFDPASDRWQALLKAEATLKDLRVGSSSTVVEVDTTKDKLVELIGNMDPEQLKAADAKELLSAVKDLLS